MTNPQINSSASLTPSRLNLRQQCILSEIIDNAQRKPGGHVATDRDGCTYWAKHINGRTCWTVSDWNRVPIAKGECS
jgi:hypothetical protein